MPFDLIAAEPGKPLLEQARPQQIEYRFTPAQRVVRWVGGSLLVALVGSVLAWAATFGIVLLRTGTLPQRVLGFLLLAGIVGLLGAAVHEAWIRRSHMMWERLMGAREDSPPPS